MNFQISMYILNINFFHTTLSRFEELQKQILNKTQKVTDIEIEFNIPSKTDDEDPEVKVQLLL